MTPPINGTVRSTTGKPLPDARVVVESAPNPTPDIAILTDADGQFTLPTVGAGEYRLATYADGHEATHTTITVTNTPVTVEPRLLPLT